MPMVQELRVGTPGQLQQPMLTPDQRVLAGRVRERRRWVIRTTLTLTLTALILCLFVIWRRDRGTIAVEYRGLAAPVAELQKRIDELHRLPVSLPNLPYRVSDAERFYAMHTTDPVLVAATERIPLILQEDGVCAIVYEAGKVRSQWMTLTEFRSTLLNQHQKLHAFEERLQSQSVAPSNP